jgi:hypothetical protein
LQVQVIAAEDGVGQFSLIDVNGRSMLSQSSSFHVGVNSITLRDAGVSAGVYYLKLSFQQQESFTKVVIE